MTIIYAPKPMNRDSARAEREFRSKLEALGATPLYDSWQGTRKSYYIRCAAGHNIYAWPSRIQQGLGFCRVCGGNDPVTAENNFLARLKDLGATPKYVIWQGVNTPHHVICSYGHDAYPTPGHTRQGIGICRVCAGLDPVTAENNFLSRLKELGATPLYDLWEGAIQPHHVKCNAGHDVYPSPASVQQGQGICRICAGKTWDVFYVIQHHTYPWIKFGITSDDPRPRLADHARQGYTIQLGLFADLPGTVAPDLERELIRTLNYEGYYKVRGREYYELETLPRIIEIVDLHINGG